SATLVQEPIPDAAATRTGEQPQLPVAGLALQKLQHRRRVGRRQPPGFGHGHSFPKSRSMTQQPRTCGPSPRQWARTSSLWQPELAVADVPGHEVQHGIVAAAGPPLLLGHPSPPEPPPVRSGPRPPRNPPAGPPSPDRSGSSGRTPPEPSSVRGSGPPSATSSLRAASP